ncbi:hypothetical protein SARC_08226 [Sphaeroforma arctica JP610]|uniref:Uncharacterized protein n=1 Tax=Sphaeroforma arctica JP610 TaxID=667725 RepID=A0A0L0FRH8_9EUKA|nr:hypothetical protein SARC_08226 [Sphaeroforma arctica JP610]KNC79380.1 hypothetical protein SARC_08226 [Sphaeroforma arctica JP610]|eukprot:XP_014153282.1 hypothetical protein SARC_08226 [Sphaeroforma arctica JP610]
MSGGRCCVSEYGLMWDEIPLHRWREAWRETLDGRMEDYKVLKVCSTHFDQKKDMRDYKGGKILRIGRLPKLKLSKRKASSFVVENRPVDGTPGRESNPISS